MTNVNDDSEFLFTPNRASGHRRVSHHQAHSEHSPNFGIGLRATDIPVVLGVAVVNLLTLCAAFTRIGYVAAREAVSDLLHRDAAELPGTYQWDGHGAERGQQ